MGRVAVVAMIEAILQYYTGETLNNHSPSDVSTIRRMRSEGVYEECMICSTLPENPVCPSSGASF